MRLALELFAPDLVIACNHAGRDQRRVDHWCTMHPDLFPMWIKARHVAGLPRVRKLWHPEHRRSPIESRSVRSWGGSSGLLCVAVAYELGCSHVVLAGIPMLPNNRHYDRTARWNEARQYHAAWKAKLPDLEGRVRSLSGWTRQILGEPTMEWLNGNDGTAAAA